jgi:urease beta subunit
MRPGEVIPGEGSVPRASGRRYATVKIANRGRFPVFLGSHFPLAEASHDLELPRRELHGARLALPAGATLRIAAGEEVEAQILWS